MNNRPIFITCLAVTLLFFVMPSTACAVLPIDLEVGIEAGSSLTAPQQWAAALGKMDLASVRIRSVRPDDQPSIRSTKVGSSKRYRLLALLDSRDQLIFPKQKFSLSQQSNLRKFLKTLPLETEYSAKPRGRFELTEEQLRKIHASFSIPIGISTDGMRLRDLLTETKPTLSTPIVANPKVKHLLAKPIKGELKGFSIGTALSLALRQQGLVLMPTQLPGKPLHLQIDRFDHGIDHWPAGWKPEGSVRRVAPTAYEKIEIEVSNYTFQQALEALQPRLKIPVILDHWILAEKDISVEVQVKMKRKKTYLKGALDRLASQARVATEVRVDENNKPFLWITQFGKQSPTASR